LKQGAAISLAATQKETFVIFTSVQNGGNI
jgi:hypothetical protein